MTSVLLPFLMSMFLGRTIDLTTYNIGGGIYGNDEYDETKVNRLTSTYTVLQENTFPYSTMGLPVDIALRIKSHIISSSSGTMGLDGLLKETSWKQRSAVIVVTSGIETLQRTLKKDAQLISNWTTRIPDSQTHYAKSISYGGWAFILYCFKCDIPGDAKIVRDTLTKTLGIYGDMKPEIAELWEDAMNAIKKNPEIRGKVTIQIHTYSTFPFDAQNLKSPATLLKAVNEFPKEIGAIGKPIFMELLPLHDLDKKYPIVKENHELDEELERIDQMYDDVKNTKNSIMRWIETTSTVFTDEQEIKIGDLLSHLSACLKLFHKVASEASVYKNSDSELLKSAIALYKNKLPHYADCYDRMFRRLKEEIELDCEASFLHKIKGLLQVSDNERIKVGKVEGGLEECKSACLVVPQCRSIGYIEKSMNLVKVFRDDKKVFKLINREKICYVYFRSSSTANVIPPVGASEPVIYDRKCT